MAAACSRLSMSNEEKSKDSEVEVSGILEILQNKTGQLIDPTRNGKTRPSDPFVPRELIKRFKLKQGNLIAAKAQHNPRHPNPKVRFIDTVDGQTMDERRGRYSFQQLTSIPLKSNSSSKRRMAA